MELNSEYEALRVLGSEVIESVMGRYVQLYTDMKRISLDPFSSVSRDEVFKAVMDDVSKFISRGGRENVAKHMAGILGFCGAIENGRTESGTIELAVMVKVADRDYKVPAVYVGFNDGSITCTCCLNSRTCLKFECSINSISESCAKIITDMIEACMMDGDVPADSVLYGAVKTIRFMDKNLKLGFMSIRTVNVKLNECRMEIKTERGTFNFCIKNDGHIKCDMTKISNTENAVWVSDIVEKINSSIKDAGSDEKEPDTGFVKAECEDKIKMQFIRKREQYGSDAMADVVKRNKTAFIRHHKYAEDSKYDGMEYDEAEVAVSSYLLSAGSEIIDMLGAEADKDGFVHYIDGFPVLSVTKDEDTIYVNALIGDIIVAVYRVYLDDEGNVINTGDVRIVAELVLTATGYRGKLYKLNNLMKVKDSIKIQRKKLNGIITVNICILNDGRSAIGFETGSEHVSLYVGNDISIECKNAALERKICEQLEDVELEKEDMEHAAFKNKSKGESLMGSKKQDDTGKDTKSSKYSIPKKKDEDTCNKGNATKASKHKASKKKACDSVRLIRVWRAGNMLYTNTDKGLFKGSIDKIQKLAEFDLSVIEDSTDINMRDYKGIKLSSIEIENRNIAENNPEMAAKALDAFWD